MSIICMFFVWFFYDNLSNEIFSNNGISKPQPFHGHLFWQVWRAIFTNRFVWKFINTSLKGKLIIQTEFSKLKLSLNFLCWSQSCFYIPKKLAASKLRLNIDKHRFWLRLKLKDTGKFNFPPELQQLNKAVAPEWLESYEGKSRL